MGCCAVSDDECAPIDRRSIRHVGPPPGPQRSYRRGRDSTTCRVCGRATRERKPWCIDHLTESTYVADLVDDLERRGLRGKETES